MKKADVFASCLLLTASAFAQTAPLAPLAYDAVSVKPNHLEHDSSRWNTGNPSSFSATNVDLLLLLSIAFETRRDLVSGLPAWATSESFNVEAKIVDPDSATLKKVTPEQRRAMLAQVLADRFQLKIHPETRQLPVYELVLAKDGSKLKPNATLPAKKFDPSKGGMPAGAFGWSDRDFNGTAVALSNLVATLASTLQRNVIDRTGLTGNYDIHLKWTPEGAASAGPDSAQPEPAPPLFTALQEQLGLKLVPAKGPVQTWVVDHIEHPTEN